MPIPSQPPRLENVIGTQADVFTIPETTPEGTAALSYQSGWPAKSATALSAGGVPPQREYFNAVNKMLSQHVFFQQSGSLYQWNNQNNYLQGAHILGSNGKEYVARQQSGPDTSAGVQDPVQDTNGTYWTSAGSSVAAGGGGLETDKNGQLYVAKLKTPRSLDGVNFDGSEPITRFAQCSTAAGTAAKTVTVNNFTLVEGATIMVLFSNTNTASSPTLNVSGTGAKPIQWRKEGVSPEWLAANRLYALTYTGTAWQIQGDITEACVQEGGGLSVDENGKLYVDFDSMPTDKFETMLKSIRVPIWLTGNKSFYVNGTTGSDTLDAGRGESADKPFKTIQAAVQYVAGNYNVGSYRATIQVADGAYEEDVSLAKYSGTTGAIEIRGNISNIEAVTLYGSIYGPAGVGQWRLVALTIKNVAGQPAMNSRNYQAINVQSGAIVTTYDCKIDLSADGPTGMLKIALYAAGGVIQIRTLTSTGSGTGLTIVASDGASIDRVLYASTIGTITFLADIDITAVVTGAVLQLSVLSIATLNIYNGATAPKFTGSVTGKRYQVTENSIANMGGNGEEFIPGTIAGTTATGGQYA